jgi:LysW-gamma-L-lysine carboxypeptidase
MTTTPIEINDADVRVLFDLVSTPSVSGDERRAAEVFRGHADRLGMDTQVDAAGNALAHRGASEHEAAVHLVLLGHIDTVPGDIPVRIEDNILHGRGSVDAKGPLSAMLVAAARAELPEGVRVTVAGAVGEESPTSPGARYLVPRYRPDACIIGEPSGWEGVTLGYKGRLVVTATAAGPNAHSAGQQPSMGDEVTAWWSRVLAHVAELNAGRRGIFHTVQATVQRLETACDGLTQRAVIEGGFRLPPGVEPDVFEAELRGLAGEHVELSAHGAEAAHATDRNDPVVRALSSAIRAQGARPHPKLKTGTADLNVVAPVWRCPIAAYGPGDSALDHAPDERLDLEEYARSIRVLTTAIEALANELTTPRSVDAARSDLAGSPTR